MLVQSTAIRLVGIFGTRGEEGGRTGRRKEKKSLKAFKEFIKYVLYIPRRKCMTTRYCIGIVMLNDERFEFNIYQILRDEKFSSERLLHKLRAVKKSCRVRRVGSKLNKN